ncbi:hypothetical protein BDM02DRAFT_3132790 [Thelephora ganbajun]|uniref:Uncharacterized protein n=1 Tax=Thelephora ganbajun TaxID=370292 RepID=A0ACB6YZM6_THEGA|nr:hypothetical protein BDM02DRAFT_3132790 [Thelephora ganbajun]
MEKVAKSDLLPCFGTCTSGNDAIEDTGDTCMGNPWKGPQKAESRVVYIASIFSQVEWNLRVQHPLPEILATAIAVMEAVENDPSGSEKVLIPEAQAVHRREFPDGSINGSCDSERTVGGVFLPLQQRLTREAQSSLSPPAEDEKECEDCHHVPVSFALLPSDPLLRRSIPFALSDPTEHVHIFQGLKEGGRSNSEGMIVDTLSGFTFLLRITCPDASGEIVVELIAVFEGDELPLSDTNDIDMTHDGQTPLGLVGHRASIARRSWIRPRFPATRNWRIASTRPRRVVENDDQRPEGHCVASRPRESFAVSVKEVPECQEQIAILAHRKVGGTNDCGDHKFHAVLEMFVSQQRIYRQRIEGPKGVGEGV